MIYTRTYHDIEIQVMYVHPHLKLDQFSEDWHSWRDSKCSRTGLDSIGWFFRYKSPSKLTYYKGPFLEMDEAFAAAAKYIEIENNKSLNDMLTK